MASSQPTYVNVEEMKAAKAKAGIHGAAAAQKEEKTVYATIQIPTPTPGAKTAVDYATADDSERVMYASLEQHRSPEEEAPPIPAKSGRANGEGSTVSRATWITGTKSKKSQKVVLSLAEKNLTLTDAATDDVIYEWKTSTIRQYGQKEHRFVIETGSRSVSGAGTFKFDLEDKSVNFADAMRSKKASQS